jgi:hypothetical protein
LVPIACSSLGLPALDGGQTGIVLGYGDRRRGGLLAQAAGLLLQPGHGVVPVLLEVPERRGEALVRLGAGGARDTAADATV